MSMHSETAASASAASTATAYASLAAVPRVPDPVNDPNRTYLPGSPERADLKARLAQMASERIDIPVVIGGREIRTGDVRQTVMPHAWKWVRLDEVVDVVCCLPHPRDRAWHFVIREKHDTALWL
jgi:hypothetical protein